MRWVQDSDQHAVKVAAVKTWTALHHMRDLTVNDIHTYYVLAGATPVLVHNCGGLDWSRAKVNEGGVNAGGATP